MGDTKGKYFSRIVAVALVALALAGCAAIFAQGNHSLFAEASSSDIIH